jgi:RNA polymerase sigma-70 factor (ECF subfamily)
MKQANRRISELEALYRRQFLAFVRVATAITGNVSLGHEAVQEAFARAIEAQSRFRGDGSLEGWMWKIVVNTARSARETPLGEQPVGELEHLLHENGRADLSPIQAWVRELPERQRLVVFLRYWADLDYTSIATLLEIEVGTVSATLNAAHRTMRRFVEQEVSP